VVALLLVSIAAVWAALLIAAPLLPAAAGATLYAFGALICHQIPERSFDLAGAQLPVCARCLGIYAGAALTGLVLLAARPHWLVRLDPRAVLLAGLVPTAVPAPFEWMGVVETSNLVRLSAGLVLGGSVALALVLGTGLLKREGRAAGS
jgi:uncharacterized membrane protein